MNINIESSTLVAHSYILHMILELLKKNNVLSDEVLSNMISSLHDENNGLSKESIKEIRIFLSKHLTNHST